MAADTGSVTPTRPPDIRVPTVELPKDSVCARVASPAFELAPPEVVYRDLIPDDTLPFLETIWSTGRFAQRSVEIHLLRDVFVAQEGLVFDRQLNVYRLSITQHEPSRIAAGAAALREAIASGGLARQPGRHALCKKRGSRNYGHWLIEMLPMAHIIRAHHPSEGLRYLVPDSGGLLKSVIATSMGMIGIPEQNLTPLTDGPHWFEELLVVTGLTLHGRYISPLVFDATDLLAAAVEALEVRRIFATRKNVGYRNFANDGDVLQAFESESYAVLDPGQLSFPVQVAMFKGAEAVAGVMGAAMTSIVFCRPGTRVLNLAPASQIGTFFWLIAGQRQLDYREVRCAQVSERRGPARWDTDLFVPVGNLAAVIASQFDRESPDRA